MECFVWMLVTLLSLVAVVSSELVDMRREVAHLMRFHNKERRAPSLRASDMTEMVWDERLARQAENWAMQCDYRRPHPDEQGVGSNLYYEKDMVFGRHSVHRFINSALKLWARGKSDFVYARNCGRTCSYTQIVYARSDRLGCALNKCQRIKAGSVMEGPSSLFVCFYSPSPNLYSSVPFTAGAPCSNCPYGMVCRKGLCAHSGQRPVPERLQNYIQDESNRDNFVPSQTEDKLSNRETHYLSRSLNNMRETGGLDPLSWDGYLERWANWVVNCKADYPGPRHCYTNFERVQQGTPVYNALYDWQREGDVTDLQLIHGCRTPYDQSRCNHMTNVRQPMLTSMACAAKDCNDGTRQMVCLFDSKVDRTYRRSNAAAYRERPRRRRYRSRYAHRPM
ncbi:GLIPR1-like protein 1 [Aplysia californica]|uniref:GLIPR1-like protein 1 n=1 Tax=Aplysia californica TaxID=6500 RepID=A0ABM0JJJ8_APLCA|nr:GLIPR1-like protein 1 [Aplysia californica]